MNTVTINKEQRLYWIDTGMGYSSLGFDVLFNWAREMAARIVQFNLLRPGEVLPTIRPEDKGTQQQYDAYLTLSRLLGNTKTGTWFHPDTPEKVRTTLERFRKNGRVVRLFYGDPLTGCCLLQSHDVLGKIGRSTGQMQVPLLLVNDEIGGDAISDDRLVGLMDVTTRKMVWQHASFHFPPMTIERAGEGDPDWSLMYQKTDGSQACFGTFFSVITAGHWLAFLGGSCFELPDE